MNSVDYKQKYLKYKNKYLELKAQEQQIQTGGFMYASGEYIFFIPESKKQLVDNELLVKNSTIPSLDKFTTELGTCSRFLRIGSTVNNKTIYTNQSSMDVMKRETKPYVDKTVAAYNVAKDESKKAWEASKPYVNKAWDATKQGAQAVGSIAKQGYDATKDALTKKPEVKPGMSDTLGSITDLQTTDEEKPKEEKVQEITLDEKVGGADDCDKLPISLPANLKGFSFDNEVNETSLVDYIKLINEKQGSEKIGRAIVVQKKTNSFGFGGETRLKYDFAVEYNGDKVVVARK
jgi:hypothetical protein